MPNFPVFRVDADQPCDPDIKTGFLQYYVSPSPMDVFPNPTDGALHINLSEAWKNERNIHIQILDQLGRVWKEKKIDGNESSQAIECDDLPIGVYFIQVKSERRWFGGEFVKT